MLAVKVTAEHRAEQATQLVDVGSLWGRSQEALALRRPEDHHF